MTDCSRCAGTNTSGPNHWSERIRDIVDFPKPGIVFKDITPLLSDGPDFASALDEMAQPWRTTPLDAVLGIEARGFILGAALARELRTGFVPVRTLIQEYALEYGTDRIEMHEDALPRGARVLIVDDVLATGGTLRAALGLAAQLELEVVGAAVLVELQGLQGRQKWANDVPLLATLSY